MLKRTFLTLALVLGLTGLVHGQAFEALSNPNVVAGASFVTSGVPAGASGTSFMLSANIAGVKLGSLPVYIGGVGIDVRTLDPAFSELKGISWTIPAVTWFPKGDQFCIQGGYSRDIDAPAGAATDRVYVGAGFSFSSPNQIKAKRAAKRAKGGN